MAQTYAPIEVVVSDNASSDGTDNILANYEGHERIRFVRHQANIGPVKNWLSAVRASRGELIKMNWSDDWIEPSVVALLVEAMDWGRGADFAVCGYTMHKLGEVAEVTLEPGTVGLRELVQAYAPGSARLPVSPGAGLVRRSDAIWALEKIDSLLDSECTAKAIGPDLLMLYGAMRRGGWGVRLPNAGVHFEGGADSITMRSPPQLLSSCYLKAVDCLLEEAGAVTFRHELRQIVAFKGLIGRMGGQGQLVEFDTMGASFAHHLKALPYSVADIANMGAAGSLVRFMRNRLASNRVRNRDKAS